MKAKLFPVLAVVALVGCATAPPKPPAATTLGTTVRGRNIDDITRDVQEWHDVKHQDCKFMRVVGAQVISQEGNRAVEHWTVEACAAKRFTYEVMIERGAHGISDAVADVGTLTGKVRP